MNMNIVREFHIPKEKQIFNYFNSKEKKGYTYCPSCKAFHEIKMQLRTFSASYDFTTGKWDTKFDKIVEDTSTKYLNAKFVEMTCPECNTTFKSEDGYELTYLDRDYAAPTLKSLDHVYFVEEKNKKDQTLLKVITVGTEYTCWNNKMQFKKVGYKIIFNIDTGMTYLVGPYYFGKGKIKAVNKQASYYSNVTYSGFHYMISNALCLTEEVYKGLFEELYRLKKEVSPYAITVDYDEAKKAKGVDMSQYATLYNRMPSVKPDEFYSISSGQENDYAKRVICRESSCIKTTTTDYYGELFKNLKVKPTKLKRKFLREGGSAQSLKVLNKLLKEPNNIYKLKDIFFIKEREVFLKALVERYGETNAVNKIASNRYSYIFVDSAKMYYQLVKAKKTFDFPNKSTLHEIHDMLSVENRKLQQENLQLKYDEKEVERFEVENDQFKLSFATCTHQLIEVGTYMGICVGSYGSAAFNRDCDILLVTEKSTDNYVCCIERRGNRMAQIKACHNYMVEGALYEFIDKWINDLKIEGGHDYKRATELYNSKTTQYTQRNMKGSQYANAPVVKPKIETVTATPIVAHAAVFDVPDALPL